MRLFAADKFLVQCCNFPKESLKFLVFILLEFFNFHIGSEVKALPIARISNLHGENGYFSSSRLPQNFSFFFLCIATHFVKHLITYLFFALSVQHDCETLRLHGTDQPHLWRWQEQGAAVFYERRHGRSGGTTRVPEQRLDTGRGQRFAELELEG